MYSNAFSSKQRSTHAMLAANPISARECSSRRRPGQGSDFLASRSSPGGRAASLELTSRKRSSGRGSRRELRLRACVRGRGSATPGGGCRSHIARAGDGGVPFSGRGLGEVLPSTMGWGMRRSIEGGRSGGRRPVADRPEEGGGGSCANEIALWLTLREKRSPNRYDLWQWVIF
jgi:hypothetical protein